MAKIKEKDGYKYSLEEFEDYKFRYKFVAENTIGTQLVNMDVYSTNENREKVEKLLIDQTVKKYGKEIDKKYTKIVHRASKEQDDLSSEKLIELLKDL